MTRQDSRPATRSLRPSSLLAVAGLGLALAPGLARAADAAVAPSVEEVTVKGARDNSQNHTTRLSTTVAASVRDTPQVVNVVPQQLIQEQKISTLEQALRDVPGITVAIGEGGTLAGDQFKIRGLDANNDIYTDGLRDFGVYVRDSFDYQEVQVLKGPSGSMFGRGTTGGAINTLSKQPSTKRDLVNVDGQVGTGDAYRGTLDVNHALNDTVAFRLNLMGTSVGVTGRDVVRSNRYGVAAAAGFGLGTGSSFVLNYVHQQDDRIPDYGIVIGAPTGRINAKPASEYGLSSRIFEQFTSDRDRSRADILTGAYRLEINPNLTFTSDSRFGGYDRYFQYTSVDNCAVQTTGQTCIDALIDNTPATVPYITFGGSSPYKQRAWGAQNISSLHGVITVAGFRNEFVVGTDVNYQDNRKAFFAYTLPPLSSGVYLPGTKAAARNAIAINLLTGAGAPPAGYTVFRPTPVAGVAATGIPGTNIASNTVITDSAGTAADYGGFVTDRLWLTQEVSLIAGVRSEDYEAQYGNTLINTTRQLFKSVSHLTSPHASLVYEPNPEQTWYLSYGKSATPVGSGIVGTATPISGTNSVFAPDEGETYEAGAKFGLLHDRLGVNAAYFHVDKDNAKQTDPATGEISAQSSQKQRIQGVELGLAGQPTTAWTLNAGYTYLDAKVIQDLACAGTPLVCAPNPVTTGAPVLQVPANSAYVWTSYKLSRWVQGLSVAGGATYQDKLHVRYTTSGTGANLVLTRDAMVPPTFSLDALIQYETPRWRVALNAYNLTDHLNYAQSFGNRAAPGPRRAFLLSLGASF
ncbi:MAG: TonB-dependent receptor [Caulobacteraceae bacterium]